MNVEKLSFRVDILQLREQFEREILPKYPPVNQDGILGGWSVLSFSGHYRDDWDEEIRLGYGRYEPGMTVRPKPLPALQSTEICNGYLADVVEMLNRQGLRLGKMKIRFIKPGFVGQWHVDANIAPYGRLHVPIITNPGAVLDFGQEDRPVSHHLDADGSAYMIDAGVLHRVVNNGDGVRYHITATAVDLRGITKFFSSLSK